MTGSSNKPYIDKLHELFPEIEIWDAGIGASEGYYATTDFKPEPIGQLNNNHYYFEFLALDKKYNDKNTLIFEELKNNSKYQLIVSTPNGFIRYNTQDIFVKENTQIRYIGRNDKTYSFVGERLTEVQITECINQISVEFGNHFNLFKMKFLNNSYTFLFFSQPPFLNEKFINQIGKKIDQFLKESNINYLYAREMYKVLNNPIIEFLPVEYYYSSNVLNSEAKLFRQEKQSLIIQ